MQDTTTLKIIPVSDTLCYRNPVADVTFYDSTSFIHSLDHSLVGKFAFTFTGINRDKYLRERAVVIKSLKEGYEVPPPPYQSDWMIPVILFSAFLFAVVRTIPGDSFRSMLRFLMMRGVNENSSRDTGILFQWQSTVLNLASFLSISLFGYLLVKNFATSSAEISGFLLWAICLAVVIVAITLRHFICIITGNISSEPEIFREYMIGVYHIYRAAGIILLAISLLVLYTTFLPSGTWLTAGIAIAALLYIIRIIRLFLIFMTRHVSILYLILYLCALEILPVVITVKYVTGLV